MRTKLLSVIVVVFAVLGLFYRTLHAQENKPPQSSAHSVWDGVYSEDQSRRGESLYHDKCALCHGDKLTGGESAPPLAGGQFLSNWNGLTLDVLFERIRASMPSDNPARVGRQPKADILAYMLSMNSFPPGKAELPPKAELLKDILFEATKKAEEKGK
ncbi:MAG TPA: cytochrome c [Candidatus Angelobacter sp.]|jgi:cytochrome c|nr:cytochrome c [Candidatus Angelobacter sp.]